MHIKVNISQQTLEIDGLPVDTDIRANETAAEIRFDLFAHYGIDEIEFETGTFYRIDEWTKANYSRINWADNEADALKHAAGLYKVDNPGDYYPHTTIQTFTAIEGGPEGWAAMVGEPETVGTWMEEK